MNDETRITKQGRKPIGDRAMTAAERKRASRLKKSAEGSTEVMIRIEKDTLEFIDVYAETVGETRSRVIEAFVHMASNQIAGMIDKAMEMAQSEKDLEEIGEYFRKMIRQGPELELLKKYKEVMKAK